jgi:hypothetical protein
MGTDNDVLTGLQLAWLIAFISSIISDVKEEFPNFAWWALVFMFLCIMFVTVTVATDAEETYNIAVWPNYKPRSIQWLTHGGLDCWISGGWYRLHRVGGQFSHLRFERRQRGCRCRLHSPFHGGGT